MKLRQFLFALLLASTGALAQPAPATAPSTDGQLCRSSTNPDLAIKHCTAAIESSKANSEMLAQWYVLRGAQWANKDDYDRAIADQTTALKIDPKTPRAYHHRGAAWSNKGEPDRALADFDAALAQTPDNPQILHARGIEHAVKANYPRALADFDAALRHAKGNDAQGVYFARGRTLFYQSEFTRAAADIETAFKAQPNIYTALWLYLARRRSGLMDADDLLERETRRIRSGWPAPVIALYLGRTDPASVVNSATDSDPVRRRELRCEADFYIAQSHLIKGDRTTAQRLLEGMQRDCPKNILEYEGSIGELRRGR
jgi:tetratricopeptide (TPR) repeat protein